MKRAAALLALLLAGCAAPASPFLASQAPSPLRDPLYAPERVVPGRLEYAPDADTFAPLLTRRVAYPTEREANAAYRRATEAPGLYVITFENAVSAPSSVRGFSDAPASLRLFACAPGTLNEATGRIVGPSGIEVHCATDFLDGAGQRLFRATVNFHYRHAVWRMQIAHPPMTPVAWGAVEHSPWDLWWWIPFRDRYK